MSAARSESIARSARPALGKVEKGAVSVGCTTQGLRNELLAAM